MGTKDYTLHLIEDPPTSLEVVGSGFRREVVKVCLKQPEGLIYMVSW